MRIEKSKEERYLRKRLREAWLVSFGFFLCGMLPIKRTRVAVSTFEGKGGFGCSPKYIVEELHRRHPEFEIVWFSDAERKDFPEYVRAVANTFWHRAYFLSTARLWLDNYRKPLGTRKRKGQFYLNTWHANCGFKRIGLWRGEAFSKIAYLVSKNDSDMIDLIPVNSEWCLEEFPRGLVYDGKIENLGVPRTDILFHGRERARERIRQKWKLASNRKILLYAPTFREKAEHEKRSVYSEELPDFEKWRATFQTGFGGDWVVFLRLHPQLAGKYGGNENKTGVIDVSAESDLYEILAGVDAVVTDYSSVAFDAVLTGMPVFLYMDDLEEYTKSRGGLLWRIDVSDLSKITNDKEVTPGLDVELPFPLARTESELTEKIGQFDSAAYQEKVQSFLDGMGIVFDGKASEHVVDRIKEEIGIC